MKILITPKINPDLDGVACAYVYARLLNALDKENKYIAGIYGQPHIEARFLLEKLNIKDGVAYNPIESFDKFIIVDASDLKGMPEAIRPEDVIEVIDHRETHKASELFPNAKIQIELVGAAATLIFEKAREVKFPIDSNDIFLLLGAIFSNTLNFKSDIVNRRDMEAVDFLSNDYEVVIPQEFIDEIFGYKTEYIKNNLDEVIRGDFKIFDHDGKLGIAQIEGYDFDSLISVKREDVVSILKELKKENNLQYIFLTAADIKSGYNLFLVIDDETKDLLKDKMGLLFDFNDVAKNSKLLLRKQILPLLI